jgi:hypothetical protein
MPDASPKVTISVWAQDAYSWPTNSPPTGKRSRSCSASCETTSEDLEGEISRLRPDLVICSRVTFALRQRVANWVELYPECKPYSTFYIDGQHRAKQDVQLSDLLELCASPP